MLFKKILTAFIFIFSTAANQKICFDVDKLEVLNNLSSFALDKLSFSSSIDFDWKEFKYLVGIKKDCYITETLLKNSCFYLKQKNKFKKICLTITDSAKSPLHKNLHFDLHATWTFNCLNLSGILVGKDPVSQMYRLEHGEPFDIEKHKHSLEDIKNYFVSKGYFDVQIINSFVSDKKTKSITVNLRIKKNNRFFVDSCNFKFVSSSNIPEKFKTRIESIYSKRFCKYYSKKNIKKTKEQLKKFLHQNGYLLSDIEIIETANNLNSSVSLSVIIYLNKKTDCFFEGNRTFSSKLLLEQFNLLGYSNFNLPIVLLEEALIKFYKSRGYWDIKISSSEKPCGFFFKISEGPRSKISKINFLSSSTYSKDRLNGFFSNITKKGYSEVEIQISIANLTHFYQKNGFLDFQCSVNLDTVANKDYCQLNVTIKEGPKYILKNIQLEGLHALQRSLLFRFKTGTVFNLKNIAAQKKFISDYLHTHGSKDYQISHEIDYHNDNKTNHLNLKHPSIQPYRVTQDARYVSICWTLTKTQNPDQFGKTIIFGSTNYNAAKILRELSFKPGDAWDRDKLNETFLRLRKINAFDGVRIYPTTEKDFLDRRPILIKLTPSNKYELKIRTGFQQVSKNLTFRGKGTYKVGASFEIKSPFLLGDQINVETDFTRFYRKAMICYKLPWIANFPINTQFQGYDNNYQQPVYIGSKKNLYEIKQKGFLASFENKKKYVDSAVNIGFEKMRISKLEDRIANAIRFSSDFINKNIPYMFFEPSIFVDHLDDKINPTRGFFSLLTMKAMVSPCHSLDFFKVFGENAIFMPIFRPIVFASRVRFGHIFIKEFQNLFPSERFYLGGPNSLRGYFPDFAPPLGTYTDNNGCKEKAPIGGNTIWNINFELRLPVYRNFGLVFFNDLGGISNPYDKMKLLYAVGTGIRYFTPVGPLRLDFAWSPKTSKKDSSIMWFFTLGQTF